jgi:hypothetical protein
MIIKIYIILWKRNCIPRYKKMILFIRNDFHQVTWCIIDKVDTTIFIYIGKIIIKLELDLFFLYGSTILPECILIVCLIIILILDLILKEKDIFSVYFIFLMGSLISFGLLLFQWNKKPIINFLGNFQTNNFNRFFLLLITLC